MAKKKKPISIASRKAKGRKLQRIAAEYISKVTGIPIEKDGDIDMRLMGDSGRDVILRGKAKEMFTFHGIECKWNEKLQIWQAIKQAEEHGGKPIVFFKRNNSDVYVVTKIEDFFDLYKKTLEKD